MTWLRQTPGRLMGVTALGIVAALVIGVSVGYLAGRRVGATAPTWRRRRSRTALARQAIGLLMLVTASRVERTVQKKLGRVANRSRSRGGRDHLVWSKTPGAALARSVRFGDETIFGKSTLYVGARRMRRRRSQRNPPQCARRPVRLASSVPRAVRLLHRK